MNNALLKTGLGMLMLGSLSLAAAAQADWDRSGHGPLQTQPAYRHSLAYSQQIDARQHRQMQRIQAGRQNGSLTRNEFRGLMHQQHEIRAMERHFRADGVIDAREYRRLDHALDRASRDIRAERHDREVRYTHNARPRFN